MTRKFTFICFFLTTFSLFMTSCATQEAAVSSTVQTAETTIDNTEAETSETDSTQTELDSAQTDSAQTGLDSTQTDSAQTEINSTQEATNSQTSEPDTDSEDQQESYVEETDTSDSSVSEEEDTNTNAELSETMYATSTVNVRSGPDLTYDKVGSLSLNQEVAVTGQADTGWYRIDYNGTTAFVSDSYLSLEQIASTAENTSKDVGTAPQNTDWVSDLTIAQSTSQLIVVAANGSSATVSMHSKNSDGIWSELLSTSASIGRNGIGKTAEGDGKTPTGVYGFSFAFGIQANPGTALSYTQVDNSYYWVDDVNSAYYNQFVSTNTVSPDWNSAEHITDAGSSYNYVLAINYNTACTPGAGSAIFMHCAPSGGAGCIAVPESSMIEILKNVQPGCVLIIDSTSGVYHY